MSKITSILLSRENAAELTLALDAIKGRAKVFQRRPRSSTRRAR